MNTIRYLYPYGRMSQFYKLRLYVDESFEADLSLCLHSWHDRQSISIDVDEYLPF